MRLRKEILRLQEKLEFSLLYVTHDPDEAFDIATQVVSMKHGRIEDVTTVTSCRDKEA